MNLTTTKSWLLNASLAICLLGQASETFAEQPNRPSREVTELKLRSKVFSNTRVIRIWLPPGYHEKANRGWRYPVFYFTDGIATFHGRRLADIAEQLTQSGKIPPAIFVGIDNGGSTRESKHPLSDRANEYLPYADDSLEPPVPNPQGKLFPTFLEQEVRPLVEGRYRTNGRVGLAGSSYGAAIALYTVQERPGNYEWLLLESPSLYIGGRELIRRAEKLRTWPSRVYVGAGTHEGEGSAPREMVEDVKALAKSLEQVTTTCVLIVQGAEHNEDAWRMRLPSALRFLLGPEACSAVSPQAK